MALWFFAFCLLVMKSLEGTFVSSWGRHDDDGGEWLFAYLTPFQLLSLSLACLSTLSETRLHDLDEQRVETCFTFWCISFFTAPRLSRQTFSRLSQPTAPETQRSSVGCQLLCIVGGVDILLPWRRDWLLRRALSRVRQSL